VFLLLLLVLLFLIITLLRFLDIMAADFLKNSTGTD
jgi:hypothetical protein